MKAVITSIKPHTLFFQNDGAVPNNMLLALLYKQALALGNDPEGELEKVVREEQLCTIMRIVRVLGVTLSARRA